jgi:hypothetical protein
MKLQQIFNTILYYIILPFAGISFILTDLTNDTRIFIGADAIADNFYSLPYGWDAAYEVKPIGNRIINWILYKVANTFVPFVSNHYTEFGWVVKATALIILIVCCYYVSRKMVFPYAFPFLFLSFVCMANFGILMSEWFAVLFSLVAIALCMEFEPEHTFVAGALCIGIALLKSITGLMVIPIICAVYLLHKRFAWKDFIEGYLLAGVAFLIMCATVWPFSIGDMLMSSKIAHVGMYGYQTLFAWFWFTQAQSIFPLIMWVYLPIVIIGCVCAGYVLVKGLIKSEYQKMGVFCLMWLVPITIVFVQSEFIVYHYLLMALPAIVTMVMLAKKPWVIPSTITLMLISFITINSVFGSFTAYEYTFWHQKETNADAIMANVTDLMQQPSLLYLDPGDAPYYFHANSSCHYITPMPVERNKPGWDLTYLPQYKETYNCIVGYQGKYIISDLKDKSQYFGAGILNNKTIMDMIERNYTRVESQSWDVYKKREN